ncbi:MAG: nitroreductase family protein [Deltaproteobacteria bacterium]|nr:nitroreductase family protein [Deltaproteobacteria bacterium]
MDQETTKNLLAAIISRRSIRKFDQEKPVPPALVREILEAGRFAPSGLNNQPWRFAIIRRPQLKEQLAQLTHYHQIVRQAPVLIAVLLDTEALYHREKDIQSVGACLENLLLAAHGLGLGAVWLGEILKRGREVVDLLQLPERYELMAVVALGYPAPGYQPKPAQRRPLKELILFEDDADG